VIVGLDIDSALIADLDFAIEELKNERDLEYIKRKYRMLDIKDSLIDYIYNKQNFNTQKFYFENNDIFVHFSTLDREFTQKFREYTKNKGGYLHLVVDNK
jgi:hypothetical protein